MSEEKKKLPKDLEKAQDQFDQFDKSVKEMTLDRMNQAPKQEVEPQTKLSSKQIQNSKDIYLKPERSISSKEPFNENYRKDYEYDKEYVQFIAEHREIIGETIETWTKPYAGMPAEFWKVPTNKPVWGPRYLAKSCDRSYHRLKMDEATRSSTEGGMTFYGSMAVDQTIQRLDARPVDTRRHVHMNSKF